MSNSILGNCSARSPLVKKEKETETNCKQHIKPWSRYLYTITTQKYLKKRRLEKMRMKGKFKLKKEKDGSLIQSLSAVIHKKYCSIIAVHA